MFQSVKTAGEVDAYRFLFCFTLSRGTKSRFQLFGDTVNTASRMQSTGQSNRIQLSEQTANLLIEAGKSAWIQPRRDLVNVKGKGIVQTYWAVHSGGDDMSVVSRHSQISSDMESSTDPDTWDENKAADGFAEDDMWGDDGEQGVSLSLPTFSKVSKNKRLVNWLTVLMTTHLKELIAQRGNTPSLPDNVDPEVALKKGEMVRDELIEAFTLPKFKAGVVDRRKASKSIELKLEVVSQLKDYVAAIADQYQDNHFHNFEHASHVTMSAMKFLNRIVVPKKVDHNADSLDADLHEYTFGITSDALSQFAVAFSALIHDVDHRGVPNFQLSKERPELGDKYKNQSIAEQNSVDIAWNLLMDPQFKDLRQCIFTNVQDVKRFRQYVVNLVMATDIFDKDMKELRNSRWKKAFDESSVHSLSKQSDGGSSTSGSQTEEESNLKATIVLEHIIQAADVSHTMQHWNVYTKWNERLFREMYAAFDNGRADKDPSEGWYKGEIWFFDNYIIPLAKKLEECDVFGVSSDECLSYAVMNRQEWEHKGEEVVKEMVERYHKKKGLEIGGFTQEEINAFSAKELEYILELLMKKGRAFGSFKSSEKAGQRTAAQAWLDSLEIHERCPAAGSLKDPTMIFPVFSGLCVFIKGGKILQDRQCSFEEGLATKFVVDAEKYGDPVHHTRALAMLCEVQAKAGNYETALETFAKIQEMYDPQKLSQAICKAYGTDRSVHSYSQSALWYHQLGDTESSLKACENVFDNILPYMDPSNILNSCELLLPIIRVLKPQGQEKRMRDMFDQHVVQNFYKHEIKFTPCRSLFEPMLMILGICHDPVDYPTFKEDLVWLLEEENGIFDDFLGNIYAKLGWSPNTLTAELCLRFAKKLYEEDGDMDKVQGLVKKGCLCVQKAEPTMRDDDWEIILPLAYEMHEPVATELVEFAGELGITAASERSVQSGDASVEKPLRTMFGLVQLS
jgi:tetratricopeptide (TPR) repeat protein